METAVIEKISGVARIKADYAKSSFSNALFTLCLQVHTSVLA